MAANVETTLELGLREAAETIWARKLVVEALGPVTALVPLELLVDAARAHAKAVGRAEGTAFALELVRGYGPLAEELLDNALRDIGATTWDRDRIETEPGLNITEALDTIPPDYAWAEAAVLVARFAPKSRRIIRPL